MGILFGFAPWLVYWILVGNVPFLTAVLIALTTAVACLVIGRASGKPGAALQIGAVATFAVLTVLTFVLDQSVMERWMQPLSNLGILLVALGGVLTGRPFIREFAEEGLLTGQRVLPAALAAAGFQFRHNTLGEALDYAVRG